MKSSKYPCFYKLIKYSLYCKGAEFFDLFCFQIIYFLIFCDFLLISYHSYLACILIKKTALWLSFGLTHGQSLTKASSCLSQPLYSSISTWQAWLYNRTHFCHNTLHLHAKPSKISSF